MCLLPTLVLASGLLQIIGRLITGIKDLSLACFLYASHDDTTYVQLGMRHSVMMMTCTPLHSVLEELLLHWTR